jgi:chromosome segregation ATPase
MSDRKLTEEELQQIRSLKQEYNNLAITLGDIELRIADLKESKNDVLEARKAINEKESTLAKQLQEKYNAGSINIETGEIS